MGGEQGEGVRDGWGALGGGGEMGRYEKRKGKRGKRCGERWGEREK